MCIIKPLTPIDTIFSQNSLYFVDIRKTLISKIPKKNRLSSEFYPDKVTGSTADICPIALLIVIASHIPLQILMPSIVITGFVVAPTHSANNKLSTVLCEIPAVHFFHRQVKGDCLTASSMPPYFFWNLKKEVYSGSYSSFFPSSHVAVFLTG